MSSQPGKEADGAAPSGRGRVKERVSKHSKLHTGTRPFALVMAHVTAHISLAKACHVTTSNLTRSQVVCA